ncbi:MAG: hypothetical protein PHI55_01070 [Burkholderiaceae bacterium]|nr:hypothetical protein [Burkholderiaceae bacterium]
MTPTALRAGRLAGTAVLALWLAACANPAREQPGAQRAEVLQRQGTPTARHAQPSGERLIYSGQPAGRQVYTLDFDAQGQLLRVEQVLTIERLQAIPVNTWTQNDILRHFGPPALVERVARFEGAVWTYRFDEYKLPRLAHVHIDPAGVVRQVLFTDEFSVSDDKARS